jgi:membrane protein DedA with SNARE-associated domain
MGQTIALVERIVRWLAPAFADAGYPIIAAAVLAERSLFIGLVVPGDVVLLLGGLYAERGDLNPVAVAALGSGAAIVGETIGYVLGRHYGLALVRRLPLVNRLGDRLEAAQGYFARRGGATVALGRYATVAGAFIPFVAGAGRMPYPRFLLYDVPAIVVWASGITALGYFFGAELHVLEKAISRFGWFMLGIIAVYFVVRWVRSRKRQHEDA